MPGNREKLGGTTDLLFLVLAIAVYGFPDEHPSVENFPGELWEDSDREGEKRHLCEDVFWCVGRQMVAKNETPTSFLNRLSRLFG